MLGCSLFIFNLLMLLKECETPDLKALAPANTPVATSGTPMPSTNGYCTPFPLSGRQTICRQTLLNQVSLRLAKFSSEQVNLDIDETESESEKLDFL